MIWSNTQLLPCLIAKSDTIKSISEKDYFKKNLRLIQEEISAFVSCDHFTVNPTKNKKVKRNTNFLYALKLIYFSH